jgi:hypothetical protein
MKSFPTKRECPRERNSFLEKMVEYSEPVLIAIGIAFVIDVVTLFISLSHKFSKHFW